MVNRPDVSPTRSGAKAFTFVASDGTRLPYLMHLPPRHRERSGGWPLVVFLHGAGERGNDPLVVLREGFPARLREDPSFPAVVLMPQCGPKRAWMAYETALLELI